ncbi:MAG TPA: hypothetical protein VIE91_02680 [Methylophilaceae bacterium]|jgi:hypothetical protein
MHTLHHLEIQFQVDVTALPDAFVVGFFRLQAQEYAGGQYSCEHGQVQTWDLV